MKPGCELDSSGSVADCCECDDVPVVMKPGCELDSSGSVADCCECDDVPAVFSEETPVSSYVDRCYLVNHYPLLIET